MLSLILSSVLQTSQTVTLALSQNHHVEVYSQLKGRANRQFLVQTQTQKLQQLIQQGEAAIKEREWAKAETIWQQVIKIQANNASAYSYFCEALSRQSKIEQAKEPCEKAVTLDPKLARTYYSRGIMYSFSGDFKNEIADYNQAIKLDPTFVMPYINRGFVYSLLRRHEEAIADYSKWIALNPKGVLAYSRRGDVYIELHRYEEAIADYSKVIALDPKDVDAYSNRGNIYLRLKAYPKALEDYKTCVNLNPTNSVCVTTLGIIYYEQGNYIAALQQFQESIKIRDSAKVNLLQAIALQKIGRTKLIKELAQKALSIDSSFAKPEVQRDNLWGDKLVSDAQKMLSDLRLN